MTAIKRISRSKVVRVLALAFAFASVLSFQGKVNADAGSGDHNLYVRVFNGDPTNDKRVAGATLELIGGPDSGLQGTTDSSGLFTFHVSEGTFAVRVTHEAYYTQDFPVEIDFPNIGLKGRIWRGVCDDKNSKVFRH